jgi:hypothetical protein
MEKDAAHLIRPAVQMVAVCQAKDSAAVTVVASQGRRAVETVPAAVGRKQDAARMGFAQQVYLLQLPAELLE